MSIDLSKIVPGDEVTVRLYVTGAYGDMIGLTASPEGSHAVSVRVRQLVSHTPRQLAVGDRVKVGAQISGDFLWAGQIRRIAALEGADAWLADDKGEHLTVGLIRLERAS